MMGTDDRDSAKCKKSKLRDIDGIIGFVLNDNKTKLCIVSSPTYQKEAKTVKCEGRVAEARFLVFLEREPLLSRLPGNWIVGILRSKKESCSTWQGLRVGSGFKEFRQTL